MEANARLLVIFTLALASHASADTLQRAPGASAPLITLANNTGTQPYAGQRLITAHMNGAPRKLRQAALPVHALPAGPMPPAVAQVQTGGTRVNVDAIAHGSAAAGVTGAVGEQQFVQLAGGRMAVFSKRDGSLLAGPVGMHTLFDDGWCAAPHAGTGAVLYDQRARRWIVTRHAKAVHCIAVSTSADAGGSYYRYALPIRSAGQGALNADDARMAIWSDTLIVTFTLFGAATGNYHGPRVCAIVRQALLRGAAAPLQCSDPGAAFGPMVAAAVAGAMPPAATPAVLMSVDFTDDGKGQRLLFWRFPATVPPLAIPVAPFRIACGDACIDQPLPGARLAAPGDRLAPQLLYRDGALLLTHAVQLPDGRTGLRWYELREALTGVHVYQQGTHAPDASHRLAGSIGIDKAGNIALAYIVAAHDTPPGVRYTGRARTDPPGRLQAEEVIVNGSGVQATPARQWAHSGSLTLDPVDGCTFWYTQQYLPLSGHDTWRSRIASFTFRNCM